MARTNEWVDKMVALLRTGNSTAAIAQIKVAPGAKELRLLQAALASAKLTGRWRDVDVAIADNIDALAAPRLHRSP
ncbi:hypothetical protein QTH87_08730 [Variovorax sp. J22P168]|uniref:hypothetical protein n=1 Tax=Variovorax jilinensis TaxID=3053513 RepID=UPI0025785917|nr:hypothetical protein [Variovorax sp. J22P168]MDM0012516.1 hypothetical protein [Variovorax sp. J22P168]